MVGICSVIQVRDGGGEMKGRGVWTASAGRSDWSALWQVESARTGGCQLQAASGGEDGHSPRALSAVDRAGDGPPTVGGSRRDPYAWGRRSFVFLGL